MPDPETRSCPSCGSLVSVGRFCDQCGAEVPADESPADSGPGPQAEESTLGGETAIRPPAPENPPHPSAADAERGLYERLARENRCPEIALEFDESHAFVEGKASSFRFRLTCRSADARKCENFVIRILNPLDPEWSPRSRVHGLFAGAPREVGISYRPRTSGFEIDSEVIVTYLLQGIDKEFRGSFAWNCLEGDASRKNAPVVNLNVGDITSDRAADLNLLQNLKIDTRPQEPVRHARTGSENRRWVPVPLFPARPRKTGLPAAEPSGSETTPTPEAVTLVGEDGRRIHFFRTGELTAGRSRRSCSLALYRFHPEGAIDENATLRISGCHFTVRQTDNGYHLWDGALVPGKPGGKASSWGLYTAEGRLDPARGLPLPWQSELPVWIVSADTGSPNCLPLFFASHPDPNSAFGHRVGGSLVLRRGDDVDELYVLLSGGLSSSALPEIGASCHFQRKGSRVTVEADDGTAALLPGETVTLGGRTWRCTLLEQHGVPPVHSESSTQA